jgi:uncharacterized repeat protein (TIGR01451 family)
MNQQLPQNGNKIHHHMMTKFLHQLTQTLGLQNLLRTGMAFAFFAFALAGTVSGQGTIYGFQGNGNTTFRAYNIATNAWATAANTPGGIDEGGAMTILGDQIYALRGSGNNFYRYDISSNSWSSLANTPGSIDEGGALTTDGTFIYALRGNSNNFYRYNIATNSWTSMSNTPAPIREGGALIYLNGFIYALRGDEENNFYRYDIAANSWASRANTPGDIGKGGALTTDGTFLYALRGDGSSAFYRYDVAANSWTTRANIGGSVNEGGALTFGEGLVYAFRGNSNIFRRYDNVANTWTTLANYPSTVKWGGALVYYQGCPDLSLTGTSAQDVAANTPSTVTLSNTTTGNLPAGDYEVTYNLSAPNAATGLTASMTVSTAGTGTFTIPGTNLASTGNTTVTITQLTFGDCDPISITANNTDAFTVCGPLGAVTFNLGESSTRCQGAGNVPYAATATNSTSITYSLDAASLAAGNTINAATGEVTYDAAWTGTSVITATAATICETQTGEHTVTVTPTVGTPVFNLGPTSQRCKEAGTVTYSATATNNTGITYSLDAASLAAGNTINASTGAVTYVVGWSGSSIITASAAGCNGPATETHIAASNAVFANDDSYIVVQGIPFSFDVLVNDLCDIDPSSVTIVDQPAGGLLTNNGNGQFTYVSFGAFMGLDQFTYQVCSNAPVECVQATVNILVQEVVDDICAEASTPKIYYLPFPENNTQLRQSLLSAASSNLLTANVRNITSISVTYPGTVIIYDHWEDGYEADIADPQQATTQIWGDGDLTNGVAPGYPTDIIPAGGYVLLDNNFPWNRPTSTIVFDGKDKIYTTASVAISKVTGDAGTSGSTLLFDVQAVKTNVSDVTRFGQFFVLPFGEDVTLGPTSVFRYTGLFVRAKEDGTVVELDYDGNGTFDVTSPTLNEGEVWFYNGTGSTPGDNPDDVNNANDIMAGARVSANKPIGVDMVFGGIDTYGTRNIPVFPGIFYGSEYYSPVYSTNSDAPVYGYFVNPNPDPITINWARGAGSPTSGSFTVAANNGISFFNMNVASGAKFESAGGESFTAVAIVDSDLNGSAYDWAFNMIPVNRLTSFATIAWAPGSSNMSANYNPVWVTPSQNTTVYVKYDGDVTSGPNQSPCGAFYDVSFSVNALQSQLIFNPSNDNSGMAVYNCDDIPMAIVWGQRPFGGTPTATPAIDVGYTMEPKCLDVLVFAVDDRRTTGQNTPITIDVASNDAAFLTQINPTSVTIISAPTNGAAVVNPNGTITYTPIPGFIGIDTLQYQICAQAPDQFICDIAKVIINVPCAFTPGSNIITGSTFEDDNLNGQSDIGEVGVGGISVLLYEDTDGNGVVDTGEPLLQTVISSSGMDLGHFEFTGVPDGDFVVVLSDPITNGWGLTSLPASFAITFEDDGLDDGDCSSVFGLAKADLAIVKEVDNTTPLVGDVVTFTLTVSNLGPQDATGVTVEDAVPAGYDMIMNISAGGTLTGSTITWSGLAVNVGTPVELTFDAMVLEPTGIAGEYLNTAAITQSDLNDPVPGNNEDTEEVTPQQADLAITKTVNNATPNVGDQVTFTITITNNGPDEATGVEAVDQLPAGLTYVSDNPSQGGYVSGTGIWIVGTIAKDATATLQITVLVTESALPSVNNIATITSSNQFDPNGGNNEDNQVVTPVAAPSIAVVKTATPTTYSAIGQVIAYQIVVENTGNVTLSNVVVTDPLTGLNATIATMLPGAVETINENYTIQAADLIAGTVVNTATASGTDPNGSPVSNSDDATIFANPNPIVAEDDTYGPVNGYTGDPNVGNALLENDLLNGVQVSLSEITATVLTPATPINGGPVPALNPATGVVSVPAGTPAGTYTIDYQICENLNPTNCDPATITVTVAPPAIVANDDTYGPVNGYVGDPNAGNVLDNDLLNGAPVVPGEVTITVVNDPMDGVTLDPLTGIVSVDPGTPAGTYNIEYQICENLNPTNCDNATVTVTVAPPAIVAEDDTYGPVNGYTGDPNVGNALLENDLLNGVQVSLSEITATVLTPATPINGGPVPALNPATGVVSVPAGTPAGTYTIDYQICENLNPTNCDPATITVTVAPPAIVAEDDTYGPVNGYTGDPNVGNALLENDLLNGVQVSLSEITATVLTPATPINGGPVPVLNTATGIVSVPSGTPAGTYTIDYQICENLNPANCDPATITVTVAPPAIVAEDDTYGPVNGYTGDPNAGNVLTNDLLNGAPVIPSEVTITVVNDPMDGVTLDPLTGIVSVDPGTPAGTYNIEYQLCETTLWLRCERRR